MATAVAFIQWDNYEGDSETPPFFSSDPLTFNSKQERLHELAEGDQLWLVSRSPSNQQYYFIGRLFVLEKKRNSNESHEGRLFGEFAIIADRGRSVDLGSSFPAEGLLRALEFESGRAVKHGASIGQSLQTLRFLNPNDEQALRAAFNRVKMFAQSPDTPCSLWTKCDSVFADYFVKNWTEKREPLAFLLYDPPPVLAVGAPVFIHSDKVIRLVATFREAQYVAGNKPTVLEEERIAERERIWMDYRETTIDPPLKSEFDGFWESQHGIRSLFVMDEIIELPKPVPFKDYGRALGWGYPMGVGYRYLSFAQSYLLLRSGEMPVSQTNSFLQTLAKINLQV